jgi:Fis family transcriptional regulator
LNNDSFNNIINKNHKVNETIKGIEIYTQSYVEKILLEKDHYNDLFNIAFTPCVKSILRTVMHHVDGNQSKASRILGISRGTLRQYLIKYFGKLKID